MRKILLVPIGGYVDFKKVRLSIESDATYLSVLDQERIEDALLNNTLDAYFEHIVPQVYEQSAEVVFIEGLPVQAPYALSVNYQLALSLDAQMVLLSGAEEISTLNRQASLAATQLGGMSNPDVLGVYSLSGLSVSQGPFVIYKDLAQVMALPMTRSSRLSPAAFRFEMTKRARQANKTIVLPEGDEPRTIRAAVQCAQMGIARCVLLANPADVEAAGHSDVSAVEGIEIINPADVRDRYVERMVELRKSKGLTPEKAIEQLQDNVVLGTMMLEQGEVDGLVSGAVHTTANTIRPPLQLIKTAPGSSMVSSVFFMLLPEQVYVYGDCAINPDPNAEQLAEIAIQSADSAKAFGLDPKVSLLSYSTGASGFGASVDKIKEALNIVREKRPDICVDGPLQYDASVMPDVAKSKAPESSVAGQANVFIFPDLNAGNIAYKAVQRSAKLLSIGPMLQGMRKPVNDLSRGALVEDIVYTIALTAIQAAA